MLTVVLILVVRLAAHRDKPTPTPDHAAATATPPMTKKEQLGKELFLDKDLSTAPGQACARCHAAATGFGQPDADLPVSRGVHPDRCGNRNDLTAAYAAFSPRFHYDAKERHYLGGLFWDGRAATLEEQAKGPFLNPLEMANPTAAAVVTKVQQSSYAGLFREVFGPEAFTDLNRAYDLVAEAIAAYERTHELNPFSSKYDLFLQGKVKLTDQERRGLASFEDKKKGRCVQCRLYLSSGNGTALQAADFARNRSIFSCAAVIVVEPGCSETLFRGVSLGDDESKTHRNAPDDAGRMSE